MFKKPLSMPLCLLPLIVGCVSVSGPHQFADIETNAAMDIVDVDGDRHISKYEMLDMINLLEQQNGGKPLTADKFAALMAQRQAEQNAELRKFFKEFDQNDDDLLKIDELDDFIAVVFDKLDADMDGALTTAEFARFSINDILAVEALEIEPMIAEVFEQSDTNKDNRLSATEVQGSEFREKLQDNRDLNQDGFVSRKELQQTFEMEASLAQFRVEGTVAYMSGTINASTPARVLALVNEHPQVDTIEMLRVPGSIDDEANIRAARYVRHFGLNTRLTATSMVASGGTDFFLAGAKREVTNGAYIGVHSWAGMEGQEGNKVDKADPQHRLYLDYYELMGIPASFYWYTLDAAPANGMYWMKQNEWLKFAFVN